MSYPKWISRVDSKEDLGTPDWPPPPWPPDLEEGSSRMVGAFIVHNGELYFGQIKSIYKVTSWCEQEGQIIVSSEHVVDLPSSTPDYYDQQDHAWHFLSIGNSIWVCHMGNLFNYDTETDTLEGPWYAGALPILDIAYYDGDIYALNYYSLPYIMRLLRFDIATGTWSTVLEQSPMAYYGALATFQGYLYYTRHKHLGRWDGTSGADVYTFDNDTISMIRSYEDSELIVGTGKRHFQGIDGTFPKIYSWNGNSMEFVVTVHTDYHASPAAFAYVSRQELYTFALLETLSPMGGLGRERVYLVDLENKTSIKDDDAGQPYWVWGHFNSLRSLCYWPDDNSIWAGHCRTKVPIRNLCAVARTYFFLA